MSFDSAGADLMNPEPISAAVPEKPDLWHRIPVIKQLRQSSGLQRGMLIAGLVITGLFVLTAIFAPLIAPFGFGQLRDASGPFGAQQPPSSAHIMGTTVGGYDVFSRVIWGAQTALLVIVMAVVFSIIIGILLGLVSGYIGGWLDRVLVVIGDAIYAFPSLLLAIVLSIVISGGQSSLWGGISAAALSITVIYIPQYYRVIRAETMRIKAEPYVESARMLGASVPRIMFRHVLRNATRTLPVIFTLNSSEAILTLAGLGFLGFGIEPTAAAEWGYDLNKALSDVTSGIWWTALYPGLAIVIAVLGITLVGESLNDLSDPRLSGRRRPRPKRSRSAVAAGTESTGTGSTGTGSTGTDSTETTAAAADTKGAGA